jgi:hypothetical protein
LKCFWEKNSEKVSEKFPRKIVEKFTWKNTRKVDENKFSKFIWYFRELKNRGLGLKTNKNKSTQVRLNILGLNMGPKNKVF